jgi:fused signal recognition particle receptor
MVFRLFRRKEKTRDALAMTRQRWGGGMSALFQGHTLADNALWEGMEEALLSADVGVETSLSLVGRVRQRVRDEAVSGASEVVELFKEEVSVLLDPEDKSIWEWYDQENLAAKPFVLLIVGVNGVGKTTSIAKLAYHYGLLDKHVIIAAADTFRAAAVEQLRVWGDRLGVDVVAHQAGADPGAVTYDAYEAAVARSADVLIVDTAGRLHTKEPLMDELRKVHRVLERLEPTAPQQTLLVLDATTGHNGLAQARVFQEATGVNGVFLAKLDGTAKGGIVVAIARELSLPVIFLGTGEGLEDISLFDTDDFVDALFDEQSGSG